MKDARVGDLVFNPADRSLWGVRHFNGVASPWCGSHTPTETGSRFTPGRMARRSTTSTSRRTAGSSPPPTARSSGRSVAAGDARSKRSWRGTSTPTAELRLRQLDPFELRLLPGRAYLYGSSYYTGVSNIFRYDIASRTLDAVSNTETGLLPAPPPGRDSLIVFRYTGEGFVADHDRGQAPRGRERDHVPRPTDRREAPGGQGVGRRIARGQSPRLPDHPARAAIASAKEIRLESVYPVVAGLQGIRRRRGAASTSPTRSCSTGRASPRPTRPTPTCQRTSGTTCGPSTSATTGATHVQLNGADFYDLFGPTKTSLKGHAVRRGLSQDAPLRRAAAARPERGRHRLRRPRAPAGLPERADGLRLDPGHAGPGSATATCATRWATSTRKRGTAGTRPWPAIASRVSRSPSSVPTSTSASPFR